MNFAEREFLGRLVIYRFIHIKKAAERLLFVILSR